MSMSAKGDGWRYGSRADCVLGHSTDHLHSTNFCELDIGGEC